MFRSIDSRDKLCCNALSTAAFRRGFASIFVPPVLTAALISLASFCHNFACICCFLLVCDATRCFRGIKSLLLMIQHWYRKQFY
jgi:hypothetical protein